MVPLGRGPNASLLTKQQRDAYHNCIVKLLKYIWVARFPECR